MLLQQPALSDDRRVLYHAPLTILVQRDHLPNSHSSEQWHQHHCCDGGKALLQARTAECAADGRIAWLMNRQGLEAGLLSVQDMAARLLCWVLLITRQILSRCHGMLCSAPDLADRYNTSLQASKQVCWRPGPAAHGGLHFRAAYVPSLR